jgi:hypothetical protein
MTNTGMKLNRLSGADQFKLNTWWVANHETCQHRDHAAAKAELELGFPVRYSNILQTEISTGIKAKLKIASKGEGQKQKYATHREVRTIAAAVVGIMAALGLDVNNSTAFNDVKEVAFSSAKKED